MLRNKEFYKDKKVIVRVDYNVPIENGIVVDDNRIVNSLYTINYLIESGAKIILMSHLGKIKSEEDKRKNSLKPVVRVLSNLLGIEVKFCAHTKGSELESAINDLKTSEVLLMENSRFEDFPGNLESNCDESLSNYWASLCDEYVMDAFGAMHRSHSSTYGIPSIKGGCTGFLVDKELDVLKEVLNSKDKIVILGGAKVNDKLGVINSLVHKSKKIILGGGMCFTFLKSLGYEIGKSILDEESLGYTRNLIDKHNDKIVLPLDLYTNEGVFDVNNISAEYMGYDIGPKTIEYYESLINKNDFVIWNGPMGKFEDSKYETGTKKLLEYLNANKVKTVIAGGDTANACKKYNLDFYYISTGGGSTLEYLSGKEFKTLEVLNK